MRNFYGNKRRIDINRRDLAINIGDNVMVNNGNKLNRKKLDPIRTGPFKVVGQLSPLMFKIDTGSTRPLSNIFHKNQLVPIHVEEGEIYNILEE
ncbi:hypothetical protein BLOT_011153 [Blomia tropicalis]|nr:hypothetical protein BLOT_011153 [Blomia tropicalis]